MAYVAHIKGLDAKYGFERKFISKPYHFIEGEFYEYDDGRGYSFRRYGVGSPEGHFVDLHVDAKGLREVLGEQQINPDVVPAHVHQTHKHMPAGTPRPIEGESHLFPYQVIGAKWLRDISKGILADDMGLGKTRQALAAMTFPALIICPANAKTAWAREAALMHPEKSVEVCSGTKTYPIESDVVIINYDILGPWKEFIMELGFETIVLDEAHYVKNMSTARFKAAKDIIQNKAAKPKNVFLLTGTPMPNRPIELFPLLWLSDSLTAIKPEYRTRKGYALRYCDGEYTPWGFDVSGASNLDELRDALRKCMLVRSKEEVLTDLPEKIEETLSEPIPKSSDYKAAEREFLKWYREEKGKDLSGNEARFMVRIGQLNKLSEYDKATSTIFKEMIEERKQSKQGTIIFFHYKESMEAMKTWLGEEAFYYSGESAVNERQEMIDAFQKGEKKFFVAQIDAAKVAITLTYADRVIFLSLPWNHADYRQASDRAYRIGQKNSVLVSKILSNSADVAMDMRMKGKYQNERDAIPAMMAAFKEAK